MKFRNTFKSVIISILIIIIVAFLAVLQGKVDIGSSYLESRLDEIELPEGISVSFSSLDRTFLNNIVLNDVVVSLDDHVVLSAEKIDTGFNIINYIFKKAQLNLTITDFNLTLNQVDTDFIASFSSNNTDVSFPVFLKSLQFKKGNVNLSFSDFTADALVNSINVTLLDDFTFSSGSADIGKAEIRENNSDTFYSFSGCTTYVNKNFKAALIIDNINVSDMIFLDRLDGDFEFGDLDNITGNFIVDKINSDYANAEKIQITGNYSEKILNLKADFGKADSDYFNPKIFLDNLSLTAEFDITGSASLSLSLKNTTIRDSDYGSIILKNSVITGKGDWKKETVSARANIGSINGVSPSYDLKDIKGDNWEANLNYSDEIFKVDFYSPLSGIQANSLIGSFSSVITGSAVFDSSELREAEFFLDNCKMAGINSPFDIQAGFTSPESLTASISIDKKFLLDSDIDIKDKNGTCRLTLNDFDLQTAENVLSRYVPSLSPYYSESTSLDGYIYLNLDLKDETTGKTNGQIAFRNVKTGKNEKNFACTLDASMVYPIVNIKQATVTLDKYIGEYFGSLDIKNLIPQGKVLFSNKDTGDILAGFNFKETAETKSFSYDIFSPYFPTSSITGTLYPDNINHIKSVFVLSDSISSYKGNLEADFQKMKLIMNFNDMAVNAELTENRDIEASFDFSSFKSDFEKIGPLQIDGSIIGSYNIESADYNLKMNDFSLSYKDLGNVLFDLYLTPRTLKVENLNYRGLSGNIESSFSSLESLAESDFSSLVADINLEGENGKIKILSTENAVKINVENFDLSVIPELGLTGNISLEGLGNLQGNLFGNISGTVNKITINSMYKLNREKINLFQASADISDNIHMDMSEFVYEFASHNISTQFDIKNVISQFKGDITRQASIKFEGNADADFSSVSGIIENTDTNLTSDFSIPSSIHKINISTEKAEISGDYINGYYIFDTQTINLDINKDFLIGINVKGHLGANLNLNITDIYFPAHLIDQIIDFPELSLESGFLRGDVQILGTMTDPEFYGTLYGNRVDMEMFWFPDQIFSLHNVIFTIDKTEISSSTNEITIKNSRTGNVNYGKNDNYIKFENWELKDYSFKLDTDSPMQFWFPMPEQNNLNIDLLLSGTVEYYGNLSYQGLRGDVTISNGVIDFDIPPLPSWAGRPFPEIAINLNVESGKDLSFYYPKESNSILNFTLIPGEKLEIVNAMNKGTQVVGNLGFQSGKIYYFQKDFFITSGEISFEDDIRNTEDELPVLIDLTAKIRDYDSTGNSVDIYLILDKSTLSNINPRFESTPSMSQAEIFSLLGQNILPDSINSPTSVSSFASLAFATTQTISKLGFINTDTIFSIDKTIREALNLDTLSFRSNILQNILFDTLPGSFLDDDLSPLAKYLDGTTIYIGKNLGYNLYLQGTLQFTGINSHYSNYTNKFLSDDLQLNLETSLDWDNEIGTFEVFSQPDELSVFNIFDNIGFSVTKTLKF